MVLAAPIMVAIASIAFVVFMVALKVRSSGSKRAPHSVLRRTLLHHIQTLAILLSLNIQWPEEVIYLFSWMTAVVSTADHMATLKCFNVAAAEVIDTQTTIIVAVAGKEASFFYTMLVIFLLLPVVISAAGYIYWVYCAPSQKCLRCGVTLHAHVKKNKSTENKSKSRK